MHIPSSTTGQIEVLPFDAALEDALRPSPDYDVDRWLYVPNVYSEYRYILGTRGHAQMVPFGMGSIPVSLLVHHKTGYFARDLGQAAKLSRLAVPVVLGHLGAPWRLFGPGLSALYAPASAPLLDQVGRRFVSRRATQPMPTSSRAAPAPAPPSANR